MTHPPLEVWDTSFPLPAPVGVESFIQPRKETLRLSFCLWFWLFFGFLGFFSICISMREILFEIYFVSFQGKKYSHKHS